MHSEFANDLAFRLSVNRRESNNLNGGTWQQLYLRRFCIECLKKSPARPMTAAYVRRVIVSTAMQGNGSLDGRGRNVSTLFLLSTLVWPFVQNGWLLSSSPPSDSFNFCSRSRPEECCYGRLMCPLHCPGQKIWNDRNIHELSMHRLIVHHVISYVIDFGRHIDA